ncbi:hypothetical protein BJP25_20140 [Actinokineospora bangkokensis]|uniref:Uncharacterized protein n=1 Tax=Actinokineospora bangkokensis TaxID=1193682 RepID=A0A1Q9LK84_9PSEU|nr:hypothetical protein BJP25_20140 [Actinokineospora bangkokensis]
MQERGRPPRDGGDPGFGHELLGRLGQPREPRRDGRPRRREAAGAVRQLDGLGRGGLDRGFGQGRHDLHETAYPAGRPGGHQLRRPAEVPAHRRDRRVQVDDRVQRRRGAQRRQPEPGRATPTLAPLPRRGSGVDS